MKTNAKLKIENVKLWRRLAFILILHFTFCTFNSAHAALPTFSELASSLADLRESIASNRAEMATFRARLDESAAKMEQARDNLAECIAALADVQTNLASIAKYADEDSRFRKLRHGDIVSKYTVTNEYGIAYNAILYGDGYIHAENARIVRRKDPEKAKKEKLEQLRRADEIRSAFERMHLPADVAAMLAERRAAEIKAVENGK